MILNILKNIEKRPSLLVLGLSAIIFLLLVINTFLSNRNNVNWILSYSAVIAILLIPVPILLLTIENSFKNFRINKTIYNNLIYKIIFNFGLIAILIIIIIYILKF